MIQNFLRKIEDYPLTLTGWLAAFSAIIALRMLVENLLAGFEDVSLAFFIGSTLVAWLFFAFSYLVVLIFLSFWLKEDLKKVANVLLWGFLLVIFPPIIDKIWCGQSFCWSFYAFDSLRGLFVRFFTFFGNNASLGITYGVRVEVVLRESVPTDSFVLEFKKLIPYIDPRSGREEYARAEGRIS